MGVMDLPMARRQFTWSNRSGASRLHKFLVSPEVVSLWPNLKQWGMTKELSDHAAIALREEAKNWGMKPFRFISAWLEHPGLGKEIKELWSQPGEEGWKGYIIQRKLGRIRRRLGMWNRTIFGNVATKLKDARREFEKLEITHEQRILSTEEQLRKSALQSRIWHLEAQEERMWRQKSRVKWLRDGDQNTSYFHRMATWRNKKNNIESLMIDGRRVEDPEELKTEIQKFLAEHFMKRDARPWTAEKMQFGALNQNQKEEMERMISKEEILLSLRECQGGDGKNDKQGAWAGRPISLVTSLYKILAKCLARRLRQVLPQLISPNQSAFLANRSILDGIMITNELIHSAKRDNRKALMIKLDFWKAYDSMSWEYLDQIQQIKSFGDKWSRRPLETAVRAKEVGDLREVEWVRNGDRMNHPQYADDTIIFCEVEMEEIKSLRRILKSFQAASGLRINYSKSKCVGIGVKEGDLRQFGQTLGCVTGQLPMEYVGILVSADPGRIKTWAPVIDKFKEKLAS
ncbi:hypothetical protein QQ045_010992 [Rhodiola kirilowii]